MITPTPYFYGPARLHLEKVSELGSHWWAVESQNPQVTAGPCLSSVTDSEFQDDWIKVIISVQNQAWPDNQITAGSLPGPLTLRWALVLQVDGGDPEVGVTLLVSRLLLHLLLAVLAAVPIGVGRRNYNILVSNQQAPTQNPRHRHPAPPRSTSPLLPLPKGSLHLHPEQGEGCM